MTLCTNKIHCSSRRALPCLSPCQLAAELQTRHRNQGVPASRPCLSRTQQPCPLVPACSRAGCVAVVGSSPCAAHGSFRTGGGGVCNPKGPQELLACHWYSHTNTQIIHPEAQLAITHESLISTFFAGRKCPSPRLLKQGERSPQSQPFS